MTDNELAKLLEQIIPHFCYKQEIFSSQFGKEIALNLNNKKYYFISYNTSGRGGNFGQLLKYIETNSSKYCNLNIESKSLEETYISHDICTQWLSINTDLPKSQWNTILDNLEILSNRTYENLPIIKTLIIDPTKIGHIALTTALEGKIIDILAGTNYTYFSVDNNLNLIDYNCISWNETTDKTDYSSLPNFLQPYSSVLKRNCGISITHSGDILIFNKQGMLISIRKNIYTVYENSLVKNLFRDTLAPTTNYDIACNIFDLIWDLSYRRHGALLILVNNNDYQDHIVNKDSILSSPNVSKLRSFLKTSIANISLKTRGQIQMRSQLLELASVDGALIINGYTGKIEAFGSIIETAPNISLVSGARTTAAKSAIQYTNMIPIKVSSDGDISLYVKTIDTITNNELFLEYKFY